MASNQELNRFRVAWFVPPELQRCGYQHREVFSELAARGLEVVPRGFRQVQPWCRWRGISTYLACVAYADRAAKLIPKGKELNLAHVTPGQFYSAGAVFFAQALIDNLAVWLCEAMSLPIRGGERHFRSSSFKHAIKKKEPAATQLIEKHASFVDELNRYRQIWIHTLSGGAVPTSDVNPFQYPNTAEKYLGVPIDPAISPDEQNYMSLAQKCAMQNEGRYLYEIGEFTERVLTGASAIFFDSLRFALDRIACGVARE